MKITKKTAEFANEESFTILDGSTVLYESPPFADSEERILEVCLPATDFYQYTIHMHDSAGNSWTNGAWIKMEGFDGNLAYMGMMSQKSDEDVPFSLYTAIPKKSTWKFSTSYSAGWEKHEFDDQSWREVVAGSSTGEQVEGTQYYRKVFTGKPDMAAIEVQLQYLEGIIAYLNGVEILRDNLPSGEIQHTTTAIGTYTNLEFHGQLRPSSLAESTHSVLAVALHFRRLDIAHTLDLDGLLSFDAPSAGEGACFATPFHYHIPEVPGVSYPSDLFNWFRQTYTFVRTPELPKTVVAIVDHPYLVPLVNGLRLWPSYSPTDQISAFEFSSGSKKT